MIGVLHPGENIKIGSVIGTLDTNPIEIDLIKIIGRLFFRVNYILSDFFDDVERFHRFCNVIFIKDTSSSYTLAG